MTTPDKVELVIGGGVHDDWESYEVDSDLLTPADAWHVTLGSANGALPRDVEPGAPVEIRVGGELAMKGHIDEVRHSISKHGHQFSISGRDGAAVLVDCSAPVFVLKQATLAEIMKTVVAPLGITRTRIDADVTTLREKINVEPGCSAWQVLADAAEANGLWPWFEPDGTLVIGGPNYDAPPVAMLILGLGDPKANNIEQLSLQRSLHERYSDFTVLGQTHGTELELGKHNLRGDAHDTGLAWYRPKIVIDHEADTPAICRDRARKLLADGRLHAFTLAATVKGHRIDAPDLPGDGRLWQPGQRVEVISRPHIVADVYFLMGRKFTGGRGQGARTELIFKEDGVWTLDAHPHKRRHRRGKNGLGPGEIVDVTGGAP